MKFLEFDREKWQWCLEFDREKWEFDRERWGE